MSTRCVLHVDMDAFFVAVELLRRPELVGRPVVVGGEGPRGVVAAASYEARAYGVGSAMASLRARRMCPELVFLPPDHATYSEVSGRVRAVFDSYTDLVEPLALDEAFLDVTAGIGRTGSGEALGHSIRQRISSELSLDCSVGVAPNKFLAKLASVEAKPRPARGGPRPGAGVVVVAPGNEIEFLHPRGVEELWGVGPATLDRLRALGVTTVGDLAVIPVPVMVSTLGTAQGRQLHDLAWGRDERPVEADRRVRSIGHEETFAEDVHDRVELASLLARMAERASARVRAAGLAARTVHLKVRYDDFTTVTPLAHPGRVHGFHGRGGPHRSGPTRRSGAEQGCAVVGGLVVELRRGRFGAAEPRRPVLGRMGRCGPGRRYHQGAIWTFGDRHRRPGTGAPRNPEEVSRPRCWVIATMG